MTDRLGQQFGNYRLAALLGQGAYAEVYVGQHVRLDLQAAIKVLHAHLTDTEAEHFQQEAQTIAKLVHPSIVRVFDFDVQEGVPFLVMDYVPNGSLRQRYPKGSVVPLPQIINFVKQVASALQFAHEHKIIHRDVKPENMLLGRHQEVLLSDFGLATLAQSTSSLSEQKTGGTIAYMAPEQIEGHPRVVSDQYALGVVVYEWLCGERPFDGSLTEVMVKHLTMPPPPLCEREPTISPKVEQVVFRALAKDPSQRFVNVQAFARALERASRASSTGRSSQPGSHVPAGVFLATASADVSFATRLKADLKARGIMVWNDSLEGTTHTPGQEQALRQEIRAVRLVVVVLSPHTRSSRIMKTQLRIAGLYERELLLVWEAGDAWDELLPEGWEPRNVLDVIDARGERYELALDEIVACLDAAITAPTSLEAVHTAPRDAFHQPRNPYKGLRAFTRADARDFFGRGRLIESLIENMAIMIAAEQATHQIGRLLTVIGPSGSGKSSVVMAGLLPRLQQGVLPGSEAWVYLEPLMPGKHPIEALGLILAVRFPERSFVSIREDLEDDTTRGLHVLASQLVKQAGGQVVLLVDQFEELFTQTDDEDERRRFLELLLTATTESRGPLLVVLTLRADFYGHPMQYPELHHLMQRHLVQVLPMEVEELRATIEQPAALADVQLNFEGNLVGDLLFEVQGQIAALPLLEFTLEQLFERRSDHRLTLSAYREIGGVKGALTQHAEQTYAALTSEEHRRLARALFMRLIDLGASEQDTTRRRAALSEFLLTDAATTQQLRETADAFIAARLLTTNEIAGMTTIEVSHEAVIREWRRLTDWIREASEDLYLLKVIREDAAEWRRYGHSVDRLYRGTQLAEALAWRERSLLNLDEDAFLQASIDEQTRQEALIVERQQQEAWQRKRYTRRTVLVGLVGLGLAVGAAATSRLLFSGNPPSLLTASLIYSYQAHSDVVESVAWSPDGKRIASASADKTVRVWDAGNGQTALTYQGHTKAVTSVAWSPDGKRIASASADWTVQVWDASSGGTLRPYTGHTSDVVSVAWSPDGKRIASASWDGTLQDGTVQVWDANSGGTLRTYTGHTNAVQSVAWSPDSEWLASASADKTVRVWDASSGQTLHIYRGHTNVVDSVAWSPDGRRLASASFDKTVRVWDASSGQTLHIFTDHTDNVDSVAWSPNGKWIASASWDRTVRVWDASSWQTALIYRGHTNAVDSMAWSPNGRWLASTSAGSVQVWLWLKG